MARRCIAKVETIVSYRFRIVRHRELAANGARRDLTNASPFFNRTLEDG
jgi:hypothetical protein